ncbi:MAG: CBS domain-containing protein [Phycisphaerae bacterium]
MRCPSCGEENIEGMEQCEHCRADLTQLFAASGPSPLEARLAADSVAAVKLRKPIVVGPETRVSEAVDRLCAQRFGCALVMNGDKLIGIFTERDLLTKVMTAGASARQRPVRDFMTPDPQTVTLQDPLASAMKHMVVGEYRHLPVIDDGKVAGVLSVRDLLGYLFEVSVTGAPA